MVIMQQTSKKVVIVGGGIAGLTAGIYARLAGFETEIYEKNSVVGGECTGWDREGYHIDNCIHWMMGTVKGTDLYKIWRTVGAVDDNIEIITSDHMYTSELMREKVTLWQDIERTRRELFALSPQDRREINNLIDDCIACQFIEIPANKPLDIMNAWELTRFFFKSKDSLKIMKKYKNMSTQDLMDKFKDPLIKCVISDFCTKESMGYSFPMAYGNYTGGDGGIPRGASREMAFRMRGKFVSLGGKLYVDSSVKKIQMAGNEAEKIVLASGKKVDTDYVICACDPSYTFRYLLGKERMDDVLKEVYAKPNDYPIYSMFQVAFAVDYPEDVLGGEVVIDCNNVKTKDWMSNRMTVKTYSYEPSFAPIGKQILQVLYGGGSEAYEFWRDKYRDEKLYEDTKREIAGRIMKRLEERFCEYRGKLSILDIWTPVTYEKYCNAYKGYNQAFTITKNSMKNPYPSAWIKDTENVLLATQWQNPPGGLAGAAIAGKFAIQRICKKEKIKVNF